MQSPSIDMIKLSKIIVMPDTNVYRVEPHKKFCAVPIKIPIGDKRTAPVFVTREIFPSDDYVVRTT